MKIKRFFLICLCLPWMAFAKSEVNPQLLEVADKYRQSKLVTMTLTKISKSELMDKETKYMGVISLAGEKFKLDIETPDKSLLLYDGAVLWNVQFPAKELGGSVQVLKSKISKQNNTQIILPTILDRKGLVKNFKVIKANASSTEFTIEPLNKEMNLKSIDLSIDKSTKTLTRLSYKDDVGNLITMQFENIKFNPKPSKNMFKFQIPKGAQVTEL